MSHKETFAYIYIGFYKYIYIYINQYLTGNETKQ